MPRSASRCASDRADAPDQADRQRIEEGALVAGVHHDEPVGLGDLRGDLGEVLRARRADGDRQPDLGADPRADPLADDLGRAEQVHRSGDVEERFVDRDALDQRREVAEHGHHLIGQPLVLREVAVRRTDRSGHSCLRPPARHPALHAEPLGLVRGGQHDTAADGDRPAAQRRIEQLLDGRVERVEVGVQDRGTGRHASFSCSRTGVRCCYRGAG